jgi:hypothetical protein
MEISVVARATDLSSTQPRPLAEGVKLVVRLKSTEEVAVAWRMVMELPQMPVA